MPKSKVKRLQSRNVFQKETTRESFQVYIASYVDIPANWIENLPKHGEVHRMNVDLPKESKKLPKLRVEKRKNTKVLESGSKRQKV